jgi:hypothetical protein
VAIVVSWKVRSDDDLPLFGSVHGFRDIHSATRFVGEVGHNHSEEVEDFRITLLEAGEKLERPMARRVDDQGAIVGAWERGEKDFIDVFGRRDRPCRFTSKERAIHTRLGQPLASIMKGFEFGKVVKEIVPAGGE